MLGGCLVIGSQRIGPDRVEHGHNAERGRHIPGTVRLGVCSQRQCGR